MADFRPHPSPRKLVINGRFLAQRITGVQRYAHELVRALDHQLKDDLTVEVRLLSPRLNGPAPKFERIVHQVVGRLQGHLWEQFDLPRHVNGATLFCPGNTAPVASLLGNERVVVTVHDLSYLYFPEAYSRPFRWLYGSLIPLVLRHASAVVTVSKSEKAAILERYPTAADRLIAIQNGGPPDGPLLPRTEGREPSVLYVGSLSKRKNFPRMLEVAARLARRRGFEFVFIGGVPDGFADTLASIAPDLERKIRLLGQVNEWSVLMSHYARSTCLFFPSLYEASPLPPIEAMACGCPVLASSIPSLRERCDDAAQYCDPTDIEAMSDAVERFVDDRALRAALSDRGKARASQFTWANCARQTLAVVLG